jgi:hypothetical protein
MTITTTATSGTCGLSITTNRNRVKEYGSNVYLKDGQKFEIELHNPHTYKVLAKIKLNGYYISTSGLVLNPGQRVFLERFIDKDESFIFSTYDVDGTPESKAAIAYNGDVEVEYYAQYIPNNLNLSGNWNTGQTYTYVNNHTTNLPLANTFYCSTNISNTAGVTQDSFSFDTTVSGTKSIETGRIDSGKKTGQKFGTSNDSFNSWVFETKKMKIIPISAKPVEVSELRNYCTNCGTRAKKASWKFCPSCGTKM